MVAGGAVLDGGEDHYRSTLGPGCVMAFPTPAGVMSGRSITAALAGAPRWSLVAIGERRLARPCAGLIVLGYRARGMRDGAAPYEAFCTSTYRSTGDGWALVQHQQTPVG